MILSVLIVAVGQVADQPASGTLAGPSVPGQPGRLTLVAYDFNDRLRRTEVEPEAAAVAVIDLSPAERARADVVLTRRAGAIDRFVAENLLLLQELDTAQKAGDKLDQFVTLLRAIEKIKRVLADGPLREQVANALSPESAARFRAVVDEYWNAAVHEGLRDSAAAGKHEARWQVNLGEHIRHLGEEIGRSFERQQASGTVFVDYLLAGLDLTAQQKQKVEELKLDMFGRAGMKPDEEEQRKLALGVMAYLNQTQRKEVLKRVFGK